MATSYTPPALTPGATNWLQKDLVSQTEKNSADIDLSSQLAKLLRDRTTYQNTADQSQTDIQRAGLEGYGRLAESFAARGLQSSTPYIQADDKAYQGVQMQLGDVRSQLADYMNNYDAGEADARLKAEQQKRVIEANALQRYASKFGSYV